MTKRTLLIPSATLVPSELQKLGKLPGVIYPIGGKISFEFLYEQYSGVCSSIDIMAYENADKVENALSVYPQHKVHVRKLKSLKDLGHTIYEGLEKAEGSVIINFADTIVTDSIFETEGDALFYQKDYMSSDWTFFDIDEKNGSIERIYDKPTKFPQEKKPIFVGVFQIGDPQGFRKALEHSFEDRDASMSTFYQALKEYSRSHSFKAIETDNWFDIGHADKYKDSALGVKAREFNHINIDRNRGILRKTSDSKEKFIGEIKWYLKLPKDVEYAAPRIFDYSTEYDHSYVSMEYYAYHTIHELFLYGDLSYQQWGTIFEKIKFVLDDFSKYRVKDEKIRESLEDMYLKKTLARLNELRDDEHFSSFFDQPIKINGKRYKSLSDIEKMFEKVIPERLCDVDEFMIIHGDLCFSNIMIDHDLSFIKIIDPRGKFGDFDIYGDRRYEFAKLLHSLDGKYDFIIKGLFDVVFDSANPAIQFNISDRKRDFDLLDLFKSVFGEQLEEIEKIELIEALLFLSMVPLHKESLKHQMVMLATGIEILDRVVDVEER